MRGCGLDCPRWAVVNMAINLWLPYNCAQFIDMLIECQPLGGRAVLNAVVRVESICYADVWMRT